MCKKKNRTVKGERQDEVVRSGDVGCSRFLKGVALTRTWKTVHLLHLK